jgi:predicted DNA-binding transcriptional regulator AlpA
VRTVGCQWRLRLDLVRTARQLAEMKFAAMVGRGGLTVVLSERGGPRKKATAMNENAEDKWITRQDLADRYGVPVKTPAQWASKGTGPRYAKIGRHVRYLLSDVIDWERKQFAEDKRHPA